MEQPDSNNPSRWGGLQTRIISALVVAGVVLGVLMEGGFVFSLFIVITALIMMREWTALVQDNDAIERVAGMAYVALPCASLIWLRGIHLENNANAGLSLTLFVIATVSATDIGAYFAGRQIGGPKLAPSISPSKTWAGLGGGILSAAIAGALCHAFTPYPLTIIGCGGLGALMAVVAQGGDLLESWMKRRAGVKDSGTLIPGHGGLLDRVDGYVFTFPLFALLFWLSGLV